MYTSLQLDTPVLKTKYSFDEAVPSPISLIADFKCSPSAAVHTDCRATHPNDPTTDLNYVISVNHKQLSDTKEEETQARIGRLLMP